MDIKAQVPPQEQPAAVSPPAHRWFIGGYALFVILSLTIYVALRLHWLDLRIGAAVWLSRLALACTLIGALLIISRLAQRTLTRRSHSRSAGYNLVRVIRLATLLAAALVVISFLNANWYAAAASLGIVSLILGFALQTPIASLIGWVYIVARAPYKVGDRIQVSDFTGDVVEISYLDTTLWEFAGDYLTSDLPSGRLIRFPNSLVFQDQVYNYSWNRFPYIWNEIPFHVAYESDLPFIEQTIQEIAAAELGTEMQQRVKELRAMISETPVDEVQVKEAPFVNFRINPNTWVEVTLVYLVEPKHSSEVRSRLIKRILEALKKYPDQAMFPKTNSR